MQEEYKYNSHTCSVNPWNPKNHIPRYHECIKGIFQPWFSDILYNVQILTNVNYQIFERAFCVPSSSVCWRMHKLKLERSCIKHIFPLEAGKTNNDQMSNMFRKHWRIGSDVAMNIFWKILIISCNVSSFLLHLFW